MTNPASRSDRLAPGPRGWPILGHFLAIRRDVLGLMRDSVREFGDVVRFRVGPAVVHLLNHPDHVEHVLTTRRHNFDKASRSSTALSAICGESVLTANGAAWHWRRRLLQPMFHRAAVARFVETMVACAEETTERWRTRARAGQPVEAASEMMRLTYRIVGKCLFGTELGQDARAVEEAMHTLLAETYHRWRSPFPWPLSWPLPSHRRFRRALRSADETVARLIRDHRERPPEKPDLLSMLLQARDAETGLSLDDTQIRNETITLLLAGHETTATALAWTLHLLALHPETQEALHAEAAGAPGAEHPEADRAVPFPLTTMVFHESLRLHPPIWAMERHAIEEDVVGGFRIPAGSSVIVSPYTLHRHRDFWDEPERFEPSRFLRDPPRAYLPFGDGPRFCVGQEFAWAEARVILPVLTKAFRWRPVAGHRVVAEPGITLRPKHGLLLEVEER